MTPSAAHSGPHPTVGVLELQPSSGTEGASGVARRALRTRDPDRAHELITETYTRIRPRISGSTEKFRFSLSTAGVGPICADTMRHSMNLRASADPLSHLTADVARRWGFAQPARFAADYQSVYGIPPQQTLRAQ